VLARDDKKTDKTHTEVVSRLERAKGVGERAGEERRG
jgi:hypothetical protein